MTNLVVHDDVEITKAIVESIASFGDSVSVNNLSEARNLLSKNAYSFVIVDLKIPDNDGGTPKFDGGYNFLKELEDASWVKGCGATIAVTNFDDLEEQFRKVIQDRLIHFVNTNVTNWRDELISKIKFFNRRNLKYQHKPIIKNFDLCILTALESEMIPFRKKMTLTALEIEGDPLIYYEGKLTTSTGATKNIIFCTLNQMGMPHTAILATKVIYNFSPKIILMSGICGGIGKDVNLGDIIISTKSYDYSSGKIFEDEDHIDFKFNANCINVSVGLHQNLSELQQNDVLSKSIIPHIYDNIHLNPKPKIHVGPIATGPFVVASQKIINKILELDRKILSVDMESYSIFLARDFFSSVNSPIVISVKSVSDRADQAKDDRFQNYCFEASSGLIFELIKGDYLDK